MSHGPFGHEDGGKCCNVHAVRDSAARFERVQEPRQAQCQQMHLLPSGFPKACPRIYVNHFTYNYHQTIVIHLAPHMHRFGEWYD